MLQHYLHYGRTVSRPDILHYHYHDVLGQKLQRLGYQWRAGFK